MASKFGETRGMTCPGCELRYDDFTTGLNWTQVRRDIIAIGFDNRRQKTKYGRRNGTLGFWHELKMMLWDQHVGECSDARDKAEAADALDGGTRVADLMLAVEAQRKHERAERRAKKNKRDKERRAEKRARKEQERGRKEDTGATVVRARGPAARRGRHHHQARKAEHVRRARRTHEASRRVST